MQENQRHQDVTGDIRLPNDFRAQVREIVLVSKGEPVGRALVDAADFEALSKHKWQMLRSGKTHYAMRSVHVPGTRSAAVTIYMHREILGLKPGDGHGIEADHINHDGLDNRRCNLRACTRSENLRNRRKFSKKAAVSALLAFALLLTSCAAPLGRLNEGAPFPYVIVSDAEMAKDSASIRRAPGFVINGLTTSHRITELHAGGNPWVAAHECAHLADQLGSYRAAIKALTPPNPNEHMAARLAVLEEIDAAGPDYWRSIFNRWGSEAIQHPNILARLEAERN